MQKGSPSVPDLDRDPLQCRIELPYRRTLHPLGFPAVIESNSSDVISSLEESWSRFQPGFDATAVRLSVVVSHAETQAPLPPPVFRSRRHMLAVTADAANFASCDLNSGYACSWVTSLTVADKVYLRDSFTEAPLLAMLSTRHLTPFHAACVVRDGIGVLLAGDSGSGKTSLAFACALRGWSLLCDDASFLVRGAGGRTVVGNPFLMRFKPEARPLFPELGERSAVPRTNGKPTIHLRTADFPQILAVQQAEPRYLIFLRRGAHGNASLVRRHEDSLHLLGLPDFGDPKDIAEQRISLQRLRGLGAFDFHYSGFDDAVERLGLLLRQGG